MAGSSRMRWALVASLAGGLALTILLVLHFGATAVAAALGAAGVAGLAFVAVQRRGAGVFERLASRFARDRLIAIAVSAEAAQTEIHEIHGHKRGLWSCFALHLVAWLASGAEAWLALKLMGASFGIVPVLALDSLLYAFRTVAFTVPNAIGVPEAAYAS